jgi:serpin B
MDCNQITKMKILFLCFVHIWTLVASAPLEANPDVSSKNTKDQPSVLSKSVSDFNSKMFEKISQLEKGNIFYSPLGLHILLSQVYLGSPKNSSTGQELAVLLGLDKENDAEYLDSYKKALATQESQLSRLHNGSVVKIATKMYVSEDLELKPEYTNMTAKYFKSSIDKVNFSNTKETVQAINNFVNNATNGLIKKIFQENEIDPDAVLILLNAIYFKGNWKYQFDKTETKMMTFHIDNSTQAEFSAMTLTDSLKTCHVKELDSNVLELPYQNEQISMVVILPSKSADVLQVEKKLQNLEATKLVGQLDSIDTEEVKVILPKFEVSFEVPEIINSLKSLGVNSLFDNADLSLISKSPLLVSDIVQQAVVKVNEEGSEAAAVTGAVVVPRSDNFELPKQFIVNRPFIFYIYDRVSHLPLFVGRIVDPNGLAKLQPAQGIRSEVPEDVEAPHAVRIVVEAPRDVVKVVMAPSSGDEVVDLPQQEIIVEDSTPCDLIGYNSIDKLPETLILPCRGHDTIALKEYQEHQRLMEDERLATFKNLSVTS